MDSWLWDVQVVDGNQSKYNLLYVVELNLEENLFANINFLLIDTHEYRGYTSRTSKWRYGENV